MDQSVPRKINLDTLSDIFTCWTPVGEKTTFETIFQLPPGCYGVFSEQGFDIKPYWELSFTKNEENDESFDDWVDELFSLLQDATKIRLRADVPVGAYLSGGLDSTFISSLIKKKFDNYLNTFSVGFSDKRYDETYYQKIAAERINTEHQTISCNDEHIGEFFPKVIWHTETPMLRTTPVPLYMLSKIVRESRFKVVLTGEGADEVFGGYNIFKEDKVRRFWAKRPDSKIRPRLIEKLYPYVFSQNRKNSIFLETYFKKDISRTELPYYSHHLRWMNTHHLKNFFLPEIIENMDSLDSFAEKFSKSLPNEFMSWDSLSKAQYIEFKLFLSNYLLSSQGDRVEMANSVEGRYPFLDYRVIEMGAKMPSEFKLNGLTENYILKHIASDFKIGRAHV
jgi:asparagine synthase (glutamine-hydrolysing)